MLKAPTDNTIVYDKPLATFWFDKDGILYSIAKNVPRTLENVKEQHEFIQSLTKGKKICAITEVSFSGTLSPEAREYSKRAMDTYKAIAILTTTPMGKMIGAILSVITPISVPVKIFNNERKARQWIEQFKNKP